jgi:hypothetical protein
MARELVRLVSGDYYKPGSPFERQLRTNATAYFLEAIARHHRHVLSDLKKNVLPDFRAAVAGLQGVEHPTRQSIAEDLRITWRDVRCDRRVGYLAELIEENPQVGALASLSAAVMTWAQRHHLNLPRLLETSLATVAAWHSDEKSCRKLLWNHWPARQPEQLALDCEPFLARGWSPDGETRAHARQRILTAVDEYLDQVEKQVRQDGWRPSPTKAEIESHVEWLALYQIDGISHSEIARGAGAPSDRVEIERKRIAAGIDSAGELIAGAAWRGWKRPPAKGGRPKQGG